MESPIGLGILEYLIIKLCFAGVSSHRQTRGFCHTANARDNMYRSTFGSHRSQHRHTTGDNAGKSKGKHQNVVHEIT